MAAAEAAHKTVQYPSAHSNNFIVIKITTITIRYFTAAAIGTNKIIPTNIAALSARRAASSRHTAVKKAGISGKQPIHDI